MFVMLENKQLLKEPFMKTLTAIGFAGMLGLLASCSINPHPMDMSQAVQSARSRADHESLAKHYEEAAKVMQAEASAHKRMLAQYEGNRGLYGKHAQTLISHCQGLIRVYEQAGTENLNMAQAHRQMAAEMK